MPYIQSGTSNSVIIKWRTNIATISKVNYGTSLADLTLSTSNLTEVIDHEMLLTNLLPNTKYYFNLEDVFGVYLIENENMFAKSSPVTGSEQFVRAWILGDAGRVTQNQKNVRNAYYDYVSETNEYPNQTDLLLLLGDNAYTDGTDNQYQNAFFNTYRDLLTTTVTWSVLGNHEGYSSNSMTQTGPYFDIFSFPKMAEAGGVASGTEAYYSFDFANVHFIVLESYTLYNDVEQIAWCLNDIQSTNQDWIIAMFHHPAYSKGSHDSDFEINSVQMRTNFLPILEENGVDIVLNGHSHSYERSYFLNGFYESANNFDFENHTVGSNGHLSGRQDTCHEAYLKSPEDNYGAVYLTTGSSSEATSGDLDHKAMYYSIERLGSCILEIKENPIEGQDLTIKFLNDRGNIDDYFTITKNTQTLNMPMCSDEENEIKVYPVPANNILNIHVGQDEVLKSVTFFNSLGLILNVTSESRIDVGFLSSGRYILKIETNKNVLYKSCIIK
jgi:hypothetical protein